MSKFLLSELYGQLGIEDDIRFLDEQSFELLCLAIQNPPRSAISFIDRTGFTTNLSPKISMIITKEDYVDQLHGDFGIAVCNDPRKVFFLLQNYLSKEKLLCRETFPTKMGEGCNISSLASISETNVIIEDGVTIEEFVVVRPNTIIGKKSVIRSGVVLGGQGYEFKLHGQKILPVEHTGGVVIGENVEIQYNSCVDRGLYVWDDTVIGAETKIDNLVHISHGVKLGEANFVVAQVGIGGRTVVGDRTWIGFNSTIKNGLRIGSDARVNMGAVVTQDVMDKGSVTGNFAIEHEKFIKHIKDISDK